MSSYDVVIVGAGINGLMAGYMLHQLEPKLRMLIVDSGGPSATFGQGRNARHFTGTEGLSLQNAIHTQKLWTSSQIASEGGWQAVHEARLTDRERDWRSECTSRYVKDVLEESMDYDLSHARLNFGGMEAWNALCTHNPKFLKFQISNPWIHVFFESEAELCSDYKLECRLDPLQSEQQRVLVAARPFNVSDKLLPNSLQVAGMTWRIQSIGDWLLSQLKNDDLLQIRAVTKLSDLPAARHYIWTIGSTQNSPLEYRMRSRVQGLGGFWLTLRNPGFHAPFKIRAPQPSGYINFTPDGDELHVSGGFGWVGERSFDECIPLLNATKITFLDHLSYFLNIPVQTLEGHQIGYCVRPSTPTGLPDARTFTIGDRFHTMISGSSKAGATQASLLALCCAEKIGLSGQVNRFVKKNCRGSSAGIIEIGLQELRDLFLARDLDHPLCNFIPTKLS